MVAHEEGVTKAGLRRPLAARPSHWWCARVVEVRVGHGARRARVDVASARRGRGSGEGGVGCVISVRAPDLALGQYDDGPGAGRGSSGARQWPEGWLWSSARSGSGEACASRAASCVQTLGRRPRTSSSVTTTVEAVWVEPWMGLGGVGPRQRFVGPRSRRGCLALAGGLAIGARGADFGQTWPDLAPVVAFVGQVRGYAWDKWRRRGNSVRWLRALVVWWWFWQAMALVCRFMGRDYFCCSRRRLLWSG